MKKRRKEMTESEKNKEKKVDRERKKELRAKEGIQKEKTETLISTLWEPGLLFGETELYKRQKEMEKKRIKEKRATFTPEEKEAENKEAKIRMKKIRENQTDEERQSQNQKSKERMRKLRIKRKMQNKCDESMVDFPDIVTRLNEIHRKEKEEGAKESNEEESENESGSTKSEDCTCDIDIDCPYCLALNKDEKYLYSINTKEEHEKFAKEELEEFKIMKKNERKEKRRAIMEKSKKPLPPLPVRELSAYEKIREEIIAQRKHDWEVYEKDWEEQFQKNMKK